ncbi:MAG: ferrous iron transport protein A [Peptostreptococcaceae bacterium]|nr:ferrous iron transport protein A [Peptostreptococcaceae bacterium]
MTLDKLKVNQQGKIKNVGGQGAIRRRLLDLGLTPNTIIKIAKVAPLGDPILVNLRGYHLTLRKEEARYIYVERIIE